MPILTSSSIRVTNCGCSRSSGSGSGVGSEGTTHRVMSHQLPFLFVSICFFLVKITGQNLTPLFLFILLLLLLFFFFHMQNFMKICHPLKPGKTWLKSQDLHN